MKDMYSDLLWSKCYGLLLLPQVKISSTNNCVKQNILPAFGEQYKHSSV